MQRHYLLLLFAIAFFGVLIIWGISTRNSTPAIEPAATSPTGDTLVERLRAERERRLSERSSATTTTTTTTAPAGRVE